MLVSGRTNNITGPCGVKVLFVSSANDMCEAVLNVAKDHNICILVASVADYTPKK